MREAEGMIRTWKVFVLDKLSIVIDKKHVLLPWLVSHAVVIITRKFMMGRKRIKRSRIRVPVTK